MTGSYAASRNAGVPDRQLRRQLAILRASIDDLQQEWDTTIELARHLRQQRQLRSRPADASAVLADLEAIMRGSAGLPDRAPVETSMPDVTAAIRKTQQTYEDLLRQHLAMAAAALDEDVQ